MKVIILTIIFGFLFFTGCKDDNTTIKTSEIKLTRVEKLKEDFVKLKNETIPILKDIREDEEKITLLKREKTQYQIIFNLRESEKLKAEQKYSAAENVYNNLVEEVRKDQEKYQGAPNDKAAQSLLEDKKRELAAAEVKKDKAKREYEDYEDKEDDTTSISNILKNVIEKINEYEGEEGEIEERKNPLKLKEVEIEKARNQLNTAIFFQETIPWAGLGLALVSFILVILIFILSRKKSHKINEFPQEKSLDFPDIEKIKSRLDKTEADVRNLKYSSTPVPDTSKQIDDLKYQIQGLKREISRQEDEKEREREIQKKQEKEKVLESLLPSEILAQFNNWAANPSSELPKIFFYVRGDVNIRTNQRIEESILPAKWITNRYGKKKFLFPNPALFNDRTNIGYLYEGKMDNLKPSGNRIEVLEPCEITENGFIEFLGKMRLL